MDSPTDWYTDEAATLGDRLAGAREAAGLSQEELAKRIGLKLKTLRAWEDDLADPRANRLQMLAGLLNVSLSWLLTGKGQGLDGPPVTDDDLSGDQAEVLMELRQLRAELEAGTARLARLEKRLRANWGADS